MQSLLSRLRHASSVVADSGDFEGLRKYSPDDATTNPTLLLQAAQKPEYCDLVNRSIDRIRLQYAEQIKQVLSNKSATGESTSAESELLDDACDELAVAFGVEILKLIPGVVSTEVDSRLSFDTAGSIVRARKLISLYAKYDVPKSRVLIKLATTWEGVQAARALQAEGINCNMTLVFSLYQAIAAAEAGAFLVSPFVGRVLDWCKANDPAAVRSPGDHPGIYLVRDVYRYFQEHGYRTIVMGASFRSSDEVLALAGCSKLTIGLKFLEELEGRSACTTDERTAGETPPLFNPTAISTSTVTPVPTQPLELTEARFRWLLNQDRMATEKLADGIRTFNNDNVKLRNMVAQRLGIGA